MATSNKQPDERRSVADERAARARADAGARSLRFTGRSAAELPADTVYALALESACLRGATLSLSRGAWTRTRAAFWPVAESAAPEIAPAAEGTAPTPVEPPADPLVVAFTAARAGLGSDTVVLALPTAWLLVRVLRLPPLAREELVGAVGLQMDKLSPFPGDELAVGWEVLAENEAGVTVFAAAAPARHLERLEAALDGAGIRLVRLDAALLAWWRVLRDMPAAASEGRQAVLIDHGGEWDLIVADAGVPVFARGLGRLGDDADVVRELTFSLLSVELDVGAQPVRDVLVVSPQAPSAGLPAALRATMAGDVRVMTPPDGVTAADGAAWRTVEHAALDLTPAIWLARERAAGIRRRLMVGLGAAAGIWLALAGALLIGPAVTGEMTRWQKARAGAQAAAYRRVSDARDRVQLIRRYMDRSQSLLEALRTVTQSQPEGVDLGSFTYRREDGCRVAGDAADPTLVYRFKDNLQTNAPFVSCKLGIVTFDAARQRHRFEMDARFEEAAP